MKRAFSLPIHPLLLSLIPVLTLFNHNFAELTLYQLQNPILISLAFGVLLYITYFAFFFRKLHPAAVNTSASILIFWFLSNNILFLQLIQPNQTIISYDRYDIVRFLIILASIFLTTILIKKIPLKIKRFTLLANIFAVCLTLIPVVSIIHKQLIRSSINVHIEDEIIFNDQASIPQELPDIYYIILDRYAGFPSLEEYYNFENKDFESFLENRNFYIAHDSFANYQYSLSSMTSSLNMIYLNSLIDQIVTSEDYAIWSTKSMREQDIDPLKQMLQSNQVTKYLKNKGYEYYLIGEAWEHIQSSEYADYEYRYKPRTPKEAEQLLQRLDTDPENTLGTFLNTKNRENMIHILTLFKNQGSIAIDQMIDASMIAEKQGPKFILLHSLLTHDPYIFDIDGTYYGYYAYNSPHDTTQQYLTQLQFANKMITHLVDTILKKSETEPIIILQADEGPYPLSFRKKLDTFDFRTDATYDDLFEKFNILNAYHFPDKRYENLYPSISPVNSFRVVLNTFFNEQIPLVTDRIYASKKYYDVKDVTEVLVKP